MRPGTTPLIGPALALALVVAVVPARAQLQLAPAGSLISRCYPIEMWPEFARRAVSAEIPLAWVDGKPGPAVLFVDPESGGWTVVQFRRLRRDDSIGGFCAVAGAQASDGFPPSYGVGPPDGDLGTILDGPSAPEEES